LANILNGAGHPKESFSFSVLGVVVSAICCRALIPQYGLNGAAIATGIGGITASFFASLSVYRKFLVLVPLIDILKIFFSVIPIYLLILKLSIPIILLPLLYLLSYLIYFGILYLIKGLNYADFELIAVFLPNKLRFHNHE
jgi:O-antigen/teichoic acid export membrane protein